MSSPVARRALVLLSTGQRKQLPVGDGFEPIPMVETTTPGTLPVAGVLLLYPKADHKVYSLDSTGAETQLGGGGSKAAAYYFG